MNDTAQSQAQDAATREALVTSGADPEQVSVARVYDYLLDGVHNLPQDRAVADGLRSVYPEVADWAWANRGFHQRAVRWMAEEAGVRQFIDIGSGLPTQNNTHQVVHAIDETATVVYVDNDPSVAAYASDLLSGDGNASFTVGDAREPESILRNPAVLARVDLGQPVALLMTAVLHFVSREFDIPALIARYTDELVSGSYVALSHGTYDRRPPEHADKIMGLYATATEQPYTRGHGEVTRFFDGLELVAPYPGARPEVCFGGIWGADDPVLADDDGSRQLYVGVAMKR